MKVVIADFGQCRPYSSDRQLQMSVDVGTRWYKAPDILYGARKYDSSVDIWSAGCILAELLDTTPLFTGFNDLD